MYTSATVKLTAWYLLILMGISLLFSVIIYRVAESEIDTRLDNLQQKIQRESDYIPLPGFDFGTLRSNQAHQAAVNLFLSLLYTNIVILVAGGIGSYHLARRTLEPIERAYEAQSRFTSDASHELRTPLAAMKTELEVALRDPKLSKKEMNELLESNLEEVNKLSELSHTLLKLSRMEYDSLEKETFDIAQLLTTVASRYDKHLSRIKIDIPKQPLFMTAHRVSMEELLTILIDNAMKYSPADSPISATLTKKNKNVQFQIKNTGEGIDESVLPYIFDRFYRADTSRTDSKKNGYGLGLALAKKIVELHSGELSATSAKHQNTTFKFVLPLGDKNETSDK